MLSCHGLRCLQHTEMKTILNPKPCLQYLRRSQAVIVPEMHSQPQKQVSITEGIMVISLILENITVTNIKQKNTNNIDNNTYSQSNDLRCNYGLR